MIELYTPYEIIFVLCLMAGLAVVLVAYDRLKQDRLRVDYLPVPRDNIRAMAMFMAYVVGVMVLFAIF